MGFPNKCANNTKSNLIILQFGPFKNSIPLTHLSIINQYQFNQESIYANSNNKSKSINLKVNPNHINYNSAATLFIQLERNVNKS